MDGKRTSLPKGSPALSNVACGLLRSAENLASGARVGPTLIPVAASSTGTIGLRRLLHRASGFRLVRRDARFDPQIPFAIAHRQRSVQPRLDPHVGPA